MNLAATAHWIVFSRLNQKQLKHYRSLTPLTSPRRNAGEHQSDKLTALSRNNI